MKKLLFVISFMMMLSGELFAQPKATCQVSGIDEHVVATVTPRATALDSSGGNFVNVTVSISKKLEYDVSVAVEVYDGNDLVASEMCTISDGQTKTNDTIHSSELEAGKTYNIRIANASCY